MKAYVYRFIYDTPMGVRGDDFEADSLEEAKDLFWREHLPDLCRIWTINIKPLSADSDSDSRRDDYRDDPEDELEEGIDPPPASPREHCEPDGHGKDVVVSGGREDKPRVIHLPPRKYEALCLLADGDETVVRKVGKHAYLVKRRGLAGFF